MDFEIKELPLSVLRLDGNTQPRTEISQEVVDDYAADLGLPDAEMPPLEAVFDGKSYWLWDGFHRYYARLKAGQEKASVRVWKGSQADAQWFALSANKYHGLRRTNADKRHAAEMALKQHPELSDGRIADHVGVSQQFISKIRCENAVPTHNCCESTPPRIGKDGRTTNTANIGKTVSQGPSDPLPTQKQSEAVAKQWEDKSIHQPAPAAKKPTKADPPLDDLGNPVPELLWDVFTDSTLADAATMVADLQDLLSYENLCRRLTARARFLPYLRTGDVAKDFEEIHQRLDSLAAIVEAGRPHAVCPACKGKTCNECRKVGYVPSWRLQEMKEQGL